VVVAPVHELDDFGARGLAGKTIITSTVNDRRIALFKDKGVHMVIDGSPMLFGHVLGRASSDAMILAATGKEPDALLEDDYLEIITDLQLEPRIIYPNGFKRVNRSHSSSTRCRRNTSRTSSRSNCFRTCRRRCSWTRWKRRWRTRRRSSTRR